MLLAQNYFVIVTNTVIIYNFVIIIGETYYQHETHSVYMASHRTIVDASPDEQDRQAFEF